MLYQCLIVWLRIREGLVGDYNFLKGTVLYELVYVNEIKVYGGGWSLARIF